MGKWVLKQGRTSSTAERTTSAYLECGNEKIRLSHSADLLERLLADLDHIEAALWERTPIAAPLPPTGPPPGYRPPPTTV